MVSNTTCHRFVGLFLELDLYPSLGGQNNANLNDKDVFSHPFVIEPKCFYAIL